MDLFIGWSGDKSYAVAEALRSWIPKVIQAIKPFLSKRDIDKGTQWREIISSKLENAHAGIFCLTNDNLDSTWLHFEAGAISKAGGGKAYVCTYLLDVIPTSVIEPLASFQHTIANKEETRSLVKTLNRALKEKSLSGSLEESTLEDIFQTFWPQLEEKLRGISTDYAKGAPQSPERPERDILEEILSLVREISKQNFPTFEITSTPWSGQYATAYTTGPGSVSVIDSEDDAIERFRKILLEGQQSEARKRALNMMLVGMSQREKKKKPDEEEK